MSLMDLLPANGRTVEESIPFSQSILWQWIKDFYINGGIDVWTEGDIPFQITNTPLLASEWAQTIFSLLRDFHRQGILDPNYPVEITELGPGTGRHAYFLLHELQLLEKRSRVLHPKGYQFTLRLAELGSKGLQVLQSHPNLQPFIAQGKLKLSLFDVSTDNFPQDLNATEPSHKPSPNPVFIIANYVLDSLPHDVILLKGKKRTLGLAAVSVRGLGAGEEPSDLKDLGERIDLKFNFEGEPVHFGNEEWNEVLRRYSGLNETYLPFPSVAMAFLEHLRGWSQTFACLLVADKSYVNIDQLRCLNEPQLVSHGGGFSFNANVHTLGYLAETWGGVALHTSPRDGTIDLSHIIVPSHSNNILDTPYELLSRFDDLEKFHAIDRFRLKESLEPNLDKPNIRLCLDLIRLSGFEPQTLYELSSHILQGLSQEELDDETESELRSILPKCLDLFYPVGDDADAPFEIGRIAYQLEMYTLSEQAYKISLQQFGEDPRTYFNLGLGWYYQQRLAESKEAFLKALELEPSYDDAQVWLKKVEEKIGLANQARK